MKRKSGKKEGFEIFLEPCLTSSHVFTNIFFAERKIRKNALGFYAEKRQNSNLQIGDKPLLAS